MLLEVIANTFNWDLCDGVWGSSRVESGVCNAVFSDQDTIGIMFSCIFYLMMNINVITVKYVFGFTILVS